HFVLVHLGSVQGIFVNGFCFPAKILVHGDHIRVGRSIFVFLDRKEFDEALLTLTDAEQNWNPPTRSPEGAGSYEAAKATVLDGFLRINASIKGIRTVE